MGFANLTSFTMYGTPLTSLTFHYIKSWLAPKNEEEEKDDFKASDEMRKLKEIRFVNPKTAAMSVSAVIKSEERDFAEMQWTVTQQDKGEALVLAYSESKVVIKEPTPPPPVVVVEEKEEKQKDEAPKKMKKRRKKKRRPKPETDANPASEGQADNASKPEN